MHKTGFRNRRAIARLVIVGVLGMLEGEGEDLLDMTTIVMDSAYLSWPLMSYFDGVALFLWSNLSSVLLLCSPLFLFYLLRLPNTSEKRVRHFTDAFIVNPLLSHRGGYPENTLSGIRLSKKRGLKVVEVDVEYTKDGCPVLLHDPTVDRTSNGTGHIRDLTLAQVREFDFGYKFG